MNKLVLLLTLSLVSVSGYASQQSELDESAQTFYTVQCGTLKEIIAMDPNSTATADQATDEDLKEIYEIRAAVHSVLTKGKAGIKELLDLGSQQDTGPFGAIMACQMVTMMEPMIKEKGCVVDLKTEKRIYDGPGFAACAKLAAKLPK